MTAHFNWHTFKSRDRTVEGRIYAPEQESGILALFCPDFTGMGATLFEQRHVMPLLDENITSVVLRHNGTRLDTPEASFIINCDQRLERGRAHGQTHLGGGPSTLSDWLYEPLIALDELSKKYSLIIVIGSSFGAIPALWSLTQPDAPINNVAEIICAGGMQGIADDTPDDIMRIWTKDFLDAPSTQQLISLDSSQNTIDTLRSVYKELPYRIKDLPLGTLLTYLVVENDEIVKPSDTQRFYEATDERGTIIQDTIDHPQPRHGLLAHDMPDYPNFYLLEHIRQTSHRR